MQNNPVNLESSLRHPWDWQHRNTRGCSTVPGVPREMLSKAKHPSFFMGEGGGDSPGVNPGV